MNKLSILIAYAIICMLAISLAAYAAPTAADAANIISSERKSSSAGGLGVQSQAGNATQLDVNASKITAHWQGYYGNITGEITLDDAQSNTLYAWSLANPTGEIFAVNTSATVNWANITCVNFTTNATIAHIKINESTLNQQYFIAQGDRDSFNKTFPNMFSGSFTVGDVTIDATDNCQQTYLYVNNQTQSSDYQEVLLFDNLSALVFTTIIEPTGTVGFDGEQWSFEMLTAQGNATVGTYYFYVELS